MKQAILCGKLLNTVKKQGGIDQVILVEDDRIQAVERRKPLKSPRAMRSWTVGPVCHTGSDRRPSAHCL